MPVEEPERSPRTAAEAFSVGETLIKDKCAQKLEEARSRQDAARAAGDTGADFRIETIEIAPLASETEYHDYIHTHSASASASAWADAILPVMRPIRGPIGRFFSERVLDDEGTRRITHEREVLGPLRAWHTEFQRKTVVPRTTHKRVLAADAASARAAKSAALVSGGGGSGSAAATAVGAEQLCPYCHSVMRRVFGADGDTHVLSCTRDGYMTELDNVDNTMESRPYSEGRDIAIMANGNRSGYKRPVHFMEALRQNTGLEATTIRPEVIIAVQNEWKRRPYIPAAKITPFMVRGWLQKHRLYKWLEHSPRIIRAITNQPGPVVTDTHMETLRAMFVQLEAPFDARPAHLRARENFLKYEYVIFKLCELQGYTNLMPYFNLLKAPERLQQHDRIWRYLCHKLGWEFYPTIT